MIPALRLSLGNGQSYERVHILTPAEHATLGVTQVFGHSTFAFLCRGVYRLVHDWNVNVIHVNKSHPCPPGSLKYERLVLQDDAIYGPGYILPADQQEAVGIPELFRSRAREQLVFTAPEGLLVVSDNAVATLESVAAVVQPSSGIIYAHSPQAG